MADKSPSSRYSRETLRRNGSSGFGTCPAAAAATSTAAADAADADALARERHGPGRGGEPLLAAGSPVRDGCGAASVRRRPIGLCPSGGPPRTGGLGAEIVAGPL